MGAFQESQPIDLYSTTSDLLLKLIKYLSEPKYSGFSQISKNNYSTSEFWNVCLTKKCTLLNNKDQSNQCKI